MFPLPERRIHKSFSQSRYSIFNTHFLETVKTIQQLFIPNYFYSEKDANPEIFLHDNPTTASFLIDISPTIPKDKKVAYSPKNTLFKQDIRQLLAPFHDVLKTLAYEESNDGISSTSYKNIIYRFFANGGKEDRDKAVDIITFELLIELNKCLHQREKKCS